MSCYPSLTLEANECNGCPTVYVDSAQLQDQAYYDQYWNGSREAYLASQYGNRSCVPCSEGPFSDTSSFRDEFFAPTCNTPCPAPVPWAHWQNAVGQRIIENASIVIGTNVATSLYSDYLYMWEELSGKAGKRLTEMIGKRKSRRQLIEDAKQNQRLFVPLPFWFTQNSGNALSLVSLQFNGVKLMVKFAELHKLIVISDPGVRVVKSCDFSPLVASDLAAYTETTYIILDVDERDRYATSNFDQLMTQVTSPRFRSTVCYSKRHFPWRS